MTSTEPTAEAAQAAQPFRQDCKDVLQQLRGALIEALSAIGVDPAQPQAAARRLGLNRNLAWKVSRIVAATDAFSAVPHVPGRGGFEILIKALGDAGADPACLARVGSSAEAFAGLIERHAGDRPTFELVASGFVADAGRKEALVQARRDAFRGNSAIWGVQARVLLTTHLLAPSVDEPGRVDLVLINGLVDLRRLSLDVSWPLFRQQGWDADGNPRPMDGEPLEPGADPSEVPLLRSFCSADLPEIQAVRGEHETIYQLPAGTVGRAGEMTCMYGSRVRSAGAAQAMGDELVCELGANLKTPVEMVQMDVLVHEDLGWSDVRKAELMSRLDGPAAPAGAGGPEAPRLTLESSVHELGKGLVPMATPLVPRYGELLSYAFECTGWDPATFRGSRIVVPYPPMPAQLLLTLDLAPADGA
jgi:hypothetical protein